MKKFILTCLLLGASLTFVSEAFAQTFPQPNRRSTGAIAGRLPHVIKLNPLSPFVLTANGAYEHFITGKLSFQLGAFYNGITIGNRSFFGFDLPSARYRSFAVTPEVRFYTGLLTRSRLDGFYIAPFGRYQNTDIWIDAELQQNNDKNDSRTFEGKLSTLHLGVIAGYKFILGERIGLEAFAGPSLRALRVLDANIETYNAEDFLSFGLPIRAGFLLGYSF